MSVFPTRKILESSNLFWQYPVITEKIFYEQNKDDVFFLGFPWATCIDKRVNTNDIFKLIIKFNEKKDYYTCCQHIHFRKFINLFKLLGITTVYTPHKIKEEDEINGVKLIACPLYAVNIEDNSRNKEFENVDFLNNEREILYSFMGGYHKGYLTSIRQDIFNMEHPSNAVVINTGGWHFESTVYSSKQNKQGHLNITNNHNNDKVKYNNLLLTSTFSLCPSGSGPNSIRFWESMACGSIPVLLADTLDLIEDIDWDNTIIRVKEHDIKDINKILLSIDEYRISELRRNCISVYNKLRDNFMNKNR